MCTYIRIVRGLSRSSRVNGGQGQQSPSTSGPEALRKSGMTINFTWVKGHQGNEGNERADRLAEIGKNSYDVQGGRSLPYVTISEPRPPKTDHTADAFVTAMREAARDTISYRQFVPRTPWITDGTRLALEEAKRAEATQAPDWKELRNKANRLAKKDRVGWVHRELTRDPAGTSSTVWNVVRRQKRGFQVDGLTLRRTEDRNHGRARTRCFTTTYKTPNGPRPSSANKPPTEETADHTSIPPRQTRTLSQSKT